jgi:hypothetical protein
MRSSLVDNNEGGASMSLIEEIKKGVTLEIRTTSQDPEYLEAVLEKKDLLSLQSILTKHLGQAAKEAGKKAELTGKIQTLVASLGGLRLGQSFYCRQEGNYVVYAALWPWESNPEKITLKAGMTEV